MTRIFNLGCLIIMLALLSGCQIGYIVKSSYYQLRLLYKKESLQKALNDPRINEDTKRKIRLVQEVKQFAEDHIHLRHSRSYESFVLLDGRYVVYAITASYKDRLEPYTWTFPFVGRVPYKGFFKKPDADEERKELEGKDLDVLERGVSAYSTLGWFADPLLSSMTAGDELDLVETVIHETTHATLYIKSSADFNERLATFVGNKGMEQFYLLKEGKDSKSIHRAQLLNEDAKSFSAFVSEELKQLEGFYAKNKGSPTLLSDREKVFEQIRERFQSKLKPQLKTDEYDFFPKAKINNAFLLSIKTYYQDLSDFQKAFDILGRNWGRFMDFFKGLKKSKDPAAELAAFVKSH